MSSSDEEDIFSYPNQVDPSKVWSTCINNKFHDLFRVEKYQTKSAVASIKNPQKIDELEVRATMEAISQNKRRGSFPFENCSDDDDQISPKKKRRKKKILTKEEIKQKLIEQQKVKQQNAPQEQVEEQHQESARVTRASRRRNKNRQTHEVTTVQDEEVEQDEDFEGLYIISLFQTGNSFSCRFFFN